MRNHVSASSKINEWSFNNQSANKIQLSQNLLLHQEYLMGKLSKNTWNSICFNMELPIMVDLGEA